MLKRHNRLRSRADFARVYHRGQIQHGRFITIKASINHKPDSRFGIVISKKISKSAVARNRVKRRITAILRQLDVSATTMDCVVMVKPAILESSSDELKQDIMTVLQRLQRAKHKPH